MTYFRRMGALAARAGSQIQRPPAGGLFAWRVGYVANHELLQSNRIKIQAVLIR